MKILHNNYTVVSQNKISNRRYYYLQDKDKKNFFAKQIISPNKDDKIKFANEIVICNYFSKLNITPKIIEYDLEGDCIILFDYVEGNTLKNTIFDVDECVKIMFQICAILEKLHAHGYIFGDLKPSNIIINETISFVDFDSVTKIGEKLEYATKMYCSPYQKRNNRAIVQFDLYSFGVIFVELLLGNSAVKQLYVKNQLVNLDISKIIVNIPNEISNMIYRLTSEDIHKNYKSIDEVKMELNSYLNKK